MAEGGDEDRRYKANLQGLFKFCTENTKLEDAPPVQAMPREKQEWLRKALEGMTANDPVKQMISALQILSGGSAAGGQDSACSGSGGGGGENGSGGGEELDGVSKDGEDCKRIGDEGRDVAMEDLIMLCEDLDLANDFYTIGGFESLPSLLKDHHTPLQSKTAHLIATLAQNNPPSQTHIIQHPSLLPHLLQRVEDEEEDDEMRVKSLYAISCSVRESSEGQERFNQLGGYKVIKKVISSSRQQKRLKLKALFLLASLCVESDVIQDIVVQEGLLTDLVAILRRDGDDDGEDDGGVKEMAVRVLDGLVAGASKGSKQACKEEPQLKEVLEGCLSRWQKLSATEDRLELVKKVLIKLLS